MFSAVLEVQRQSRDLMVYSRTASSVVRIAWYVFVTILLKGSGCKCADQFAFFGVRTAYLREEMAAWNAVRTSDTCCGRGLQDSDQSKPSPFYISEQVINQLANYTNSLANFSLYIEGATNNMQLIHGFASCSRSDSELH